MQTHPFTGEREDHGRSYERILPQNPGKKQGPGFKKVYVEEHCFIHPLKVVDGTWAQSGWRRIAPGARAVAGGPRRSRSSAKRQKRPASAKRNKNPVGATLYEDSALIQSLTQQFIARDPGMAQGPPYPAGSGLPPGTMVPVHLRLRCERLLERNAIHNKG